MRVISGVAKGRRLFTPKGQDIRPTSDRIKEAMFNIIGRDVEGAVVLDIFAGTGSLGIEALSRGASKAYLIDAKKEAIDLIRKNLDATGFKDRAVIIKAEADKALKRLASDGIIFNLIFLDPPYKISVTFLEAILLMLLSYFLSSDGLLVLEHSAKVKARAIDGLEIESTRVYGDTAVTFYRKKG